jgi:hypothetical protein
MRSLKTLLAAVAALCFLALYSSLAESRGPSPNPKPPGSRGAPGPVVAAGLSFLVVTAGGAYWLIRRRRSRASD